MQSFCEQYKEDTPNIDISREIDNWESLWLNHPVDNLPTNMPEAIKAVNPLAFQIYLLFSEYWALYQLQVVLVKELLHLFDF